MAMIDFEDPLRKYQREAAELEATRERERRAMQREHRTELRQRERDRAAAEADIDARIAAALAAERAPLLDAVCDVVGEAIGQLLQERIGPISDKLAELERLLQRLREMSAAERGQPIDLPSLRFRSSRAN